MPPDTAQSYYTQGLDLYEKGDAENAIEKFQKALDIDEQHGPSYAKIAEILIANQETLSGIGFWALAIKADPENNEYADRFLNLTRSFDLQIFNDEFKQVLLLCLKNPNVDTSNAGKIWFGLLKLDPNFKLIYKASFQKNFKAFKKTFLRNLDVKALLDPYFIYGLQRLVIFDSSFERFLSGLRRILLEELSIPIIGLSEDKYTRLVNALSHYCYYTEYIFDCSVQEQDLLATLITDIQNDHLTEKHISILACYKALNSLDNANEFKGLANDKVYNIQVKEYYTMQKIKDRIETISEIKNSVSLKVKRQYEEFPYPRWEHISTEIKNIKNESFLHNMKANILVAGCGTGREAVELAASYPNSKILAIDLSLTSLSYGINRAEEFNIKNIIFKQSDILDLKHLKEKFDFIACSGVLHHMEDPIKGWEILTNLLIPGGTMRIGLYSRLARQSIIETRKLIKTHNISNDSEGIRNFRAQADSLIDKHTLDTLKKFRDYYVLSECRDLLFHVQEHCFDILQIQNILDTLSLSFKGFYLNNRVANEYSKMFSNDPEQTSLSNWSELEKRQPDTFSEMYRFWCTKS